MGLRDRGIIDYYIPLFAGAATARLNRWRLRFPSDIYAPYIPGGEGVGGGDGGYDTPVDATIQNPTITYPSLVLFEDVPECDSITSDAFVSSNGQTHIASRWIIELIDLGGELETTGAGTIVFDSYADSNNLTSLAMVPLSLVPGASYRIRVRYKGSGGGWSDLSVPVVFVMRECGYTCPLPDPAYTWSNNNLGTNEFLSSDDQHWNISTSGSGVGRSVRSKAAITGKKYCELIITTKPTGLYSAFGIANVHTVFYNAGVYSMFSSGRVSGAAGLPPDGFTTNGTVSSSPLGTIGIGDVIGLAVDNDAGQLWFSKNGAAIVGPVSFTPGTWYFHASTYNLGETGTGVFTILPTGAIHGPPSGFTPFQP